MPVRPYFPMGRPRTLALATITLLVVPNTCMKGQASSPAVSSATQKCSGLWSAPSRVLPATTEPARVFRDATITASRWGTLVFGNNVAFFNKSIRTGDMFAGAKLADTALPAPPGRFTFTSPIALHDADGTVRLYWIEPDTIADELAPYQWSILPFTSVWSAALHADGQWTTPVRLFRGPLAWALNGPDRRVSGFQGDHIVFTTGQEFVFLTAAQQGDSLRRVPVPLPFPAYPSLATDGLRMTVAFIAADPKLTSRNINSVFAQSSVDGGISWGSPLLVHHAGASGGYDTRLLRSSDGQLHIVWRAQARTGETALHHVASKDDGQSWSASDSLVIPPGAAGPRVALDSADRIHVVYDDWAGGGTSGHIDHVVWDKGWGLPSHLFADLRPTNATIFAEANGNVLIVFLTHSPGGSVDEALLSSMYSRWHCS
jgi:hypothetical protein